ncbi:MAG: hypothetical protein HC808_20400, partial [Candidatus Competibacteraceae bacterium]|nr:hypothetical protein [Candidatus Competibacteraceae bacterium]
MRARPLIAAALLLTGFHTGVWAQSGNPSISLSPPSANPRDVGDLVSFILTMDFSAEATLGGGFDVFYDAAILDFNTFVFSNTGTFPRDMAFDSTPVDLAGQVQDIGFGSFSGLSGPFTVGIIVFNAIGPGTANLTLADTAGTSGAFISNDTFDEMTVDYFGNSVTVNPVPLPGALLLMAPGLLAI